MIHEIVLLSGYWSLSCSEKSKISKHPPPPPPPPPTHTHKKTLKSFYFPKNTFQLIHLVKIKMVQIKQ